MEKPPLRTWNPEWNVGWRLHRSVTLRSMARPPLGCNGAAMVVVRCRVSIWYPYSLHWSSWLIVFSDFFSFMVTSILCLILTNGGFSKLRSMAFQSEAKGWKALPLLSCAPAWTCRRCRSWRPLRWEMSSRRELNYIPMKFAPNSYWWDIFIFISASLHALVA